MREKGQSRKPGKEEESHEGSICKWSIKAIKRRARRDKRPFLEWKGVRIRKEGNSNEGGALYTILT